MANEIIIDQTEKKFVERIIELKIGASSNTNKYFSIGSRDMA